MQFVVMTRFFRFMPAEALQRMNDELKTRGHRLAIIRPQEMRLRQGQASSLLYLMGQQWSKVDLVMPLLRWNDDYGWLIMDELQQLGQTTVKSSRLPQGNRVMMNKIFHEHGVRLSQTYVMNRATVWKERHKLPWPLQVQARVGQGGRVQQTVHSWNELDETLQEYEQVLEDPLFMRDIRNLSGPIVSVLVVGDRCLASVEHPDGMRTITPRTRNLGGQASKLRPAHLSPTDEKAVTITRRLYGVTHAVVDIKQTSAGPIILDVNTAPNLAWYERVSGHNLMGKVVEFWETLAKAAKK